MSASDQINDPMHYIRTQYGVPAKIGGRVEYSRPGGWIGGPETGTITGAQGAHLLIRLDGYRHPGPFHPTWQLRYLDEVAPTPPTVNSGDGT